MWRLGRARRWDASQDREPHGDRRERGPSGVNGKAREVTRRALPHAQLAQRATQRPSGVGPGVLRASL